MRHLASLFVALAFAACGGKVAFDGLPVGAGGASSSSNASHASSIAQTATVSSVAQTSDIVAESSSSVMDVVATSVVGTSVVATSVSASTGPMMPGICDSGLTDNQPGCDMCLTASCCAEADACTKHNTDVGPCEKDIQGFEMCAQGCGNSDACISMCAQAWPLSGPLFSCARKACFMECMI